MNRPKTYTAAAILQTLLSVMNGIGSVPFLMRGSGPNQGPPFFVELVLFATAVLGLVAAYGVWHNQRWGAVLMIILNVLTGLVNLPGLLFAPGIFGKVATAVSLIPAIVIIVLLLWPKPRLAPVDRGVV